MLPSYLKENTEAVQPIWDAMNNDVRLRIGTIVKVYPPESNGSVYGNQTEYDVRVVWSDSRNNINDVFYPRVRRASLFGSIADKFEYSLRQAKNFEYKDGAQVLLACVNGHQKEAYIIGGAPHPKQVESLGEGHTLYFEFNGVKVEISDQGEIKLTRTGPTNDDGSPREDNEEANRNASIHLTQEGNIALTSGGDKPQKVLLDHANSKIYIEAGDSGIEVSAAGKISLVTEGLEVNGAREGLIRGDTYRKAESDMLKSLSNNLKQVAASLSLAAAELTANAPTAAGPKVLEASTKLLASGIAIDLFEAQASQYVSGKHKID